MELLDANVIGALKDRLFDRERLARLLSSLAERRAAPASSPSPAATRTPTTSTFGFADIIVASGQ